MSDAIRIGVLGTGGIAGRALLEPAQQMPEVAVTAVGSRTPERAEAFAAEHGIGRATTYEGLLQDPDIDVVYITLPPSLHAEWSIRAMEAGKAVLCEKPLASNAEEAAAIDTSALRTGGVFLEAFHYHHHPLARRLRDLVGARAIGTIERVEAGFSIPERFIRPGNIRLDGSLGGGALMDAGCYPVHAVRHLLGEPEVVGATATTSDDDPRVDVASSADLRFPGGATGTVSADFQGDETAEVELVLEGSRGRLAVTSLYVPQWGGRLRGEWDGHQFEEPVDLTPTYVFQLQDLVRVVRDGAPVLTTAADGVRTMAVIDACYTAAGLEPRAGSLVA